MSALFTRTRVGTALGVALLSALISLSLAPAQNPLLAPPANGPQPDDPAGNGGNQQMEVLTHGPVHEAFAESVQLDAKVELITQKQPPAAIEEIPPDVKPAGQNVVWIPGYWSWDDSRNDFLWISGIYRETPPNRTWVPGYWAAAGNVFKWTPGFWAQAQAQQVDYLPQPPATLENGPTSVSPGPDHYWVSGIHVYRNDHYAWRPGYWTVVNPNWIWIPDHYVWTPAGYVFVSGYWDYPLARRGVLFAPVYFSEPIYTTAAWYYRPAVVIDVGVLSVHLWNRPSYCHYYFGDYYAENYVALGYSPWYTSYASYHGCYDPCFNYYRCVHRDNPRWSGELHSQHDFYVQHTDYRPPMLYTQQAAYSQKIAANPPPAGPTIIAGAKVGGAGFVMGASLKDAVANKNVSSPVKFEKLSTTEHQQLTSSLKDVKQFHQDRLQHESAVAASGGAGTTTGGTGTAGTTANTTPAPKGFGLHGKTSGGVTVGTPGSAGSTTAGGPGTSGSVQGGVGPGVTGTGSPPSTLPKNIIGGGTPPSGGTPPGTGTGTPPSKIITGGGTPPAGGTPPGTGTGTPPSKIITGGGAPITGGTPPGVGTTGGPPKTVTGGTPPVTVQPPKITPPNPPPKGGTPPDRGKDDKKKTTFDPPAGSSPLAVGAGVGGNPAAGSPPAAIRDFKPAVANNGSGAAATPNIVNTPPAVAAPVIKPVTPAIIAPQPAPKAIAPVMVAPQPAPKPTSKNPNDDKDKNKKPGQP